jgi:hypothetical protein
MDFILFIISIIVIIFIYYLISVIKDLQLEIKEMTLTCTNNAATTDTTKTTKPIQTIDTKIKNDIVGLLDFAKNYFI